MKDNREKSNKPNKSRKYTDEFKNNAVELANKIGLGKAANQLGISNSTLSDWKNLKANKDEKKDNKSNNLKHSENNKNNNKNNEKTSLINSIAKLIIPLNDFAKSETKKTIEENAILKYELENSRNEIKKLNDNLNTLKNQNNDLENQLNEKLSLINSITELITPLNNFAKNETLKTIEINADLKRDIKELKNQITKYQNKIQILNEDIKNLKSQKSELESKTKELKNNNNELNEKLNDAYSINSREASLEAEKIREDLKKSFTYLYEEWQEYSDSEYNENNYESLQAIINKIFRALRKNGIEFRSEKNE